MVHVKVTVAVGTRNVAAEDLTDCRAAALLESAGQDIGKKLEGVQCAVHARGPTNVRVHFDKRGAADLRYDSCCEALTAKIGELLG